MCAESIKYIANYRSLVFVISFISIQLIKYFSKINSNVIQAGTAITDQSLNSVSNFITGVLVARSCSKSEFGMFLIGLTILRLLVGFQNSLILIPYTIQLPRCDSREKQEYFGSVILHQLGMCVLVIFALFISAIILDCHGAEKSLTKSILILSVISTPFMIREFIRLTLLARLSFFRNLVFSVLVNITTVIMMYLFYILGRLNPENAFIIIAISSGIPSCIVFIIYWTKTKLVFGRIIDDFKFNYKIGKWLTARSLATMGAVSVYPLALGGIHGAAQAGVYGVCYQLASLLMPIFMGLNSYLHPRLSHLVIKQSCEAKKLVIRISLLLGILLLSVLVIFLFFGDSILVSVYGEEYHGYSNVLLLLTLAISLCVLSGPVSVFIDTQKKTKITFLGRLVGAALSLTFGIILLSLFSIVGAASGLCFSHLASLIFLLFYMYYRESNNNKSKSGFSTFLSSPNSSR